jgi:hypothetical protein
VCTTCSTFTGSTGAADLDPSFKLDRAGVSGDAVFASSVAPFVFSTGGNPIVWSSSLSFSSSFSLTGLAFSMTGTSSFLGASSTFSSTVISPAFPVLSSSGFDCVSSPAFPTGMKFDLTRVLNPFPPKDGPVSFCSGFTNALPPCCSKKALSEETCSSGQSRAQRVLLEFSQVLPLPGPGDPFARTTGDWMGMRGCLCLASRECLAHRACEPGLRPWRQGNE